jgi:hypothetical protein
MLIGCIGDVGAISPSCPVTVISVAGLASLWSITIECSEEGRSGCRFAGSKKGVYAVALLHEGDDVVTYYANTNVWAHSACGNLHAFTKRMRCVSCGYTLVRTNKMLVMERRGQARLAKTEQGGVRMELVR